MPTNITLRTKVERSAHKQEANPGRSQVRAATAARDRSPPSLNRSSLPQTGWPLLADSLEGVRSVGAGKKAKSIADESSLFPDPYVNSEAACPNRRRFRRDLNTFASRLSEARPG
jgi:hypothetical protein